MSVDAGHVVDEPRRPRVSRAAPGRRGGALVPWVSALVLTCQGLLAAARADVLQLGAGSQASGNVKDQSWNHIVPAGGANRYLVIGVALDHTQRDPFVEALRYAGMPLTFLGGHTLASEVRVELWGMASPPEGTNPIDLRLSEPRGFVAGAAAFSGVDPTVSVGALVATSGTTAQAAIAAGGSPGGRIVDVYGSSGVAAVTAGPSQTAHFNLLDRVLGAGASRPVGGAGTSTWETAGAMQPWALIAIPLEPAAPADAGAIDGAADATTDAPEDTATDAGADAILGSDDGASDAEALDGPPDIVISGFGDGGSGGDVAEASVPNADAPDAPDVPNAPDAPILAGAADASPQQVTDGAGTDAPAGAAAVDAAGSTDARAQDGAMSDARPATDGAADRLPADVSSAERPATLDAARPEGPTTDSTQGLAQLDSGTPTTDATAPLNDGDADTSRADALTVRRVDLDVGCACRAVGGPMPTAPRGLVTLAVLALALVRRAGRRHKRR